MELHHQFVVPASIEETWDLFTDMGSVATCFPGVRLESVSSDACEGVVKVKLGPISQQYKGTAAFVERSIDDRHLTIRAGGKDRRGQGTADATITIALGSEEERTRVDVDTDLAITGKPAQFGRGKFGRGMIQDVSDTYLAQFVEALSQRLTTDPETPDDDDGPGPHTARPAGGGTTGSAPRAAAASAAELNVAGMAVGALARRYPLQLAGLALAGLLLILRAVRG